MDKPLTSYSSACSYLDGLQMHKIKLGLEAVRATLSRLGSPEMNCPAVHVAGTNGKGSVCAMLQSMLSEAGYTTGLYTSPHLSSVRERFRIDDGYIKKDDFTRLMEAIRASLQGEKITYFECTTALAFSWFAEQECDLVILETGMGGRLDATNVVSPLLSVITTISLDHEQYLGNSIAQVAYEKAGIIKDGVPVVSGVLDPEARPVIETACRQRGAPLMTRGIDFFLEPSGDMRWRWKTRDNTVAVAGIEAGDNAAWQVENRACAVAAAIGLRKQGYDIPDRAILHGVASARWPGRMEYIELTGGDRAAASSRDASVRRFLLDGAHNQAGVDYLIGTVKRQFTYRRLFVIWASMADKAYAPMLRDMADLADHLLLTRPESERSAAPGDLLQVLERHAASKATCFSTVAAALQWSIQHSGQEDLIVVAGSLYLIGACRKLLVGEVVT